MNNKEILEDILIDLMHKGQTIRDEDKITDEVFKACEKIEKMFVTPKKRSLPIFWVLRTEDFKLGIEHFIQYQPVNVVRELKDKFHRAIGTKFVELNLRKWDADLIPLKEFYKFKRAKS